MDLQHSTPVPGSPIHSFVIEPSSTPIQRRQAVPAKAPSAHFLNDREELILIAIPWIGAVLTLGFVALEQVGIEYEISNFTILLTTLIFLDSVHILWTYVLWIASPELRQWVKSNHTKAKTGWLKGRGPWGQSLVIAGLLGFIFWFIKGSMTWSTLRGMATTWLLLDLVGPAQHTVAQMKGISLCYNSNLRKTFTFTAEEKKRALLSDKLERLFFRGLLFGEIFYWLPKIFNDDKFKIVRIDRLQDLGGILIIGSAIALLANGLYFPKQEESRKLAFLFRVMLFPLKMLSVIGGVSIRAAHGTEYLFVFRRIMQGSSITQPKRTKIFLVTIALSLLYLIPYGLTWSGVLNETFGWKFSDILLGWALGLVFVLRFTHYYMDALLFRMSDPATRMIVGPILTTPPG